MVYNHFLLRLNSFHCVRCQPIIRNVHYQVNSIGEKVVVSTRTSIRTKREKWQNVESMDKEKVIKKIRSIERNDRLHSNAEMARITAEDKLAQLENQLRSSGFCREIKPYDPPKDVNERIDKISKELFGSIDSSTPLTDLTLKFKFLVKCHQEFDYDIPNSELFRMKTVEDVRNFYQTPISGRNNYDQMIVNQSKLPQNLHIISEPIRFNKKFDQFFGGISAFPGPSNELEGLRARKKYPVFNDNFVWPDV